jgi:hypothetical protein
VIRLWEVALATTANACAFPARRTDGNPPLPKNRASHSYRRFSRVKLARDEHAVYQPAAGKGLGPGRHGRFIYAPMADDHEAKLLALSLAYVNCRRDFIRAMLIAHADGMSYQQMARITGLSEITLRGLIRPGG